MEKITKNREKKIAEVGALVEKLEKTKLLFLADYQGLTHKQLEDLRKQLKKVKGEILVTKNRLLKIAIKETKNAAFAAEDTVAHLEKMLEKPTAAILAYGDEIEPIKALAAFIKTTQLPKIKSGMFGGKPATDTDFKTLSHLPSRDVLLATVAMRLKGPLYGLHYALRWNLQGLVTALDNVKSKKTN